jgi:hypothetical protein
MKQFGRRLPKIVDEYMPKGGMCMTCIHRSRDCSGLPFATMPIISIARNRVAIVKCTEHERDSSIVIPTIEIKN